MFWLQRILGNVYVFLMQTIKPLTDIFFVFIINRWCHNIILGVYVVYLF